ncbi:MAG: hypothetical protein WC881_07965 [Elusimicrobiota bacterium]|jgi:hypothetical protein
MKKIAKTSAHLVALSLIIASQPWPAFAQMQAQVGRSAASGVPGVPVGAVKVQLGSGLNTFSPAMNLNGSLILPQSPIPLRAQVIGAQAQTLGTVPTAVAAYAAPVTAQAAARAAALAAPQAGLSALSDASAEAAAPAASPKRSLLGQLSAALSKLSLGRAFDNSRASAPGAVLGFVPGKKNLPVGVVLDEAPSAPDPKKVSGISIENYEIPGALSTGEDIFSAAPAVLLADAASEADVERALRALVDADPVKYGISSADLATVHVRRIPGQAHQADTVFALFRQNKNGLDMHGSFLSFTVKVIKGQPVVMASMAKLYPKTGADTDQKFPDEELKDKAVARLGSLVQDYDLELSFLEKKIVYIRGVWHAANIYVVEGGPMPFAIAVDVATGEALMWDPRAMAVGSGQIEGRTVDVGPTKPDSKLVALPMGHLNVKFGDNKTTVTDKDGKFANEVVDMAPPSGQFTATLSGAFARVSDANRKDLSVSGTLTPGQEVTVTFNPIAMDGEELAKIGEEEIAQVNAYRLVNRVHDWLKERNITHSRLDAPIPVRVNINDDCNAYYTPSRPSLNFFKSSANCVNTAFDSVVMHEYGHFVDDMLGGIVDGGQSEGWGDIFSMYILNNPIVGEGFLKNANGGKDYVRHGENDYKYNRYDEVHAQGQAWMGFGWKLRKAFIAAMGEAAGAALAEALVLPVIYAKASNIPATIAQVLLNDMDKDGKLPHEDTIRATARIHGIELPKAPGTVATLVRRAVNFMLGRVGLKSSVIAAGVAGLSFDEPRLQATITFSVGVLGRTSVRNQIEMFLDSQSDKGITYELKEYKDWLSSDFRLVIHGPESRVRLAAAALESWFKKLASN